MEKFKPVLASSTWFSALLPYLQEAMFDKMRLKHLKAGQQLHAKGEDGVGFYGVCEGRLRVVTVGVDGREMLFALLGPGTWKRRSMRRLIPGHANEPPACRVT